MEFLDPSFERPVFSAASRQLRAEVRKFLREEREAGNFTPICNAWVEGFSSEFSQKLGARGWIGHHWPKRYGGREGTAYDTFIINEELLAAGAPVNAHWTAARQSGPVIMRYASEDIRLKFLPEIAAGRLYFAIGLSEPDSGSDLASVRTRARQDGKYWRITGRKIWTTSAHRCQWMIVLCRTSPLEEGGRHHGLTQFIVDLKSEGVSIRPILALDGSHHFNEVLFEDVEVPEELMLGNPGDAWRQVSSELAYERSGPERFLSSLPFLDEFLRTVGQSGDRHINLNLGRMIARLVVLRGMSLGIAGSLNKGNAPDTEAALVKGLGSAFERETIEAVRGLAGELIDRPENAALRARFREALFSAPTYTIRGGTNEILRNIVAKRLKLS